MQLREKAHLYPQSYTDTKEKDLVKLATRGGAYICPATLYFVSIFCSLEMSGTRLLLYLSFLEAFSDFKQEVILVIWATSVVRSVEAFPMLICGSVWLD